MVSDDILSFGDDGSSGSLYTFLKRFSNSNKDVELHSELDNKWPLQGLR